MAWDLMYTFVDDLVTIIEGGLKDLLDAEKSVTYRLPMVKVYDYEINVPEQEASLVILPESMEVTAKEAGSDIFTGNVMLWTILRDAERKYPRRLYLYEKALRKLIFTNKNYSGREYWADRIVYGMERTMGSRLVKDMALTVMCRGQYSY